MHSAWQIRNTCVVVSLVITNTVILWIYFLLNVDGNVYFLGLQLSRCMSGYPADWKTDSQIVAEHRTSMSDIPVPEGSWQENYSKRNGRWNMYLGASTVFFAVTLFAVSLQIFLEMSRFIFQITSVSAGICLGGQQCSKFRPFGRRPPIQSASDRFS